MDLDTSSDDEDLPPLSRCPTRDSHNSTPPLEDNYPDPDDPVLDCIHVATYSSPTYPHTDHERVILRAIRPKKIQKYPQPTMRRDLPVNFPPLDEGEKLPRLTDETSDWNSDLNGGVPLSEMRWVSNLDGAIPPPSNTVTQFNGKKPYIKLKTKSQSNLIITNIPAPTSNARNAPSPESSIAAPKNSPQWTRPWKRKEFKEDGVWLCPRCERVLDQENPSLKDYDEVTKAQIKLDICPPFLRKETEPFRRRKCGHCERENFCHLFWHSNGGSESTE
ncbi:hypothetical protein B0J13DRAFT_1927 [Dactylonectria estremocensis]|uniref:Uncharacterized protein n=1 Tax=Dactylonectria estremocensis TaxID=1079267 RepID=A0A9P9FG38_9HYPO|nr:hypothetical protein B0J13DRAFT_1927 [Dactylonectria estremocensis]